MPYTRRMRDLRIDNDMTQKQIAAVLNTSQRAYSRYETGTSELPIKCLMSLCEHYNVSVDYILGFTNDPKPLPEK